jgi:hypothetical protein
VGTTRWSELLRPRIHLAMVGNIPVAAPLS